MTAEPQPPGRAAGARRPAYQLEGRHAGMLLGRFVALPVLAVAAVAAPVDGVTSRDRWLAVLACGGVLAVCALLMRLPQRDPRSLLVAANAVIVADGVLIGVLAILSGGHDSPALWLLPLAALAATLGYSVLNGVKAAVLGGIVVGAVHLQDGLTAATLTDHAGLAALTLATVAVGGAMARVNEGAIRSQADRALILHRAALDLGAAEGREAILAAGLDAVGGLMPGWEATFDDGRTVPELRLWREDGHARLETPVGTRSVRPGPDGGPPRDTEERFGVLSLRRPVPRTGPLRVRRSQLEALETLIRTMAVSLSRDALIRQLAHLSASDALTGLANRRVFDRDLAAELARARRSGSPAGLALVDVDHFKRFNDTHGHQAGDEALVAVARTLEESARAEDRVCRIGGEEFALILPGTDTAAAAEVGERVRRAIAAMTLPYGPVTASIGVATSDGTHTPAEVVAAADACLYRAKDGGRNRVVAAAEAAPA